MRTSLQISPKKVLVADILKNEGNLLQPGLSSEQIVMVILQFCIGEVIPSKRRGYWEAVRAAERN
jgi:hypothetical protein